MIIFLIVWNTVLSFAAIFLLLKDIPIDKNEDESEL